jgi:hypothetical protein
MRKPRAEHRTCKPPENEYNSWEVDSYALADVQKEVHVGNIPKVGDRAPEFELPDSTGKKRTLAELLSSENAVLVFFRGVW